MPRANAMVPPEAIRIEDEVWQEAFTRREPARSNRERRLNAIDGELPDWLVETSGKTLAEAASWSVPRASTRERAAARRTAGAPMRSAPIAPTVSIAAAPEAPGRVAAAVSPLVDEPTAAPMPVLTDEVSTGVVAVAGAMASRTGAPPARPGSPPGRRTIKIQGRGAERNLPLPDSSRRRPQRRPYERSGFRPDRLAMWAVMLGFLLVLIAILSAH